MPEPGFPSDALPHLKSDPAHWGFQYLEDIATAYWYAEVLFSSVELDLFGHIEAGATTVESLAAASGCRRPALARLLTALTRMDLIHDTSHGLVNSQMARRFLISGRPDYMGDFILYRRYMQAGWRGLTEAVACPDRPVTPDALTAESDYGVRNFHYVRAMDRLARTKAREIVACLRADAWNGPVLDVGGGAGALCRELVKTRSALDRSVSATLFDLPEVIDAVRRLYPEDGDGVGIEMLEGDFRYHAFPSEASYGLVALSNFLHAYAKETARELLIKAAALTAPGGVLLIHDYFPDRAGKRPHKGALYDLNMMLNTYDGACHPFNLVCEWLTAIGMHHRVTVDLESDSTILLAGRSPEVATMVSGKHRARSTLDIWSRRARQIGFSQSVLVGTDQIRTASWSRVKCRFGCAGYGRNRMCPPDGIDHKTLVEMLKEYRWALLVVDTPPGKQFHGRLLALEREAFLGGLHKALAFGAGPCPICAACPDDGSCRHPDRARPSMESAGIDVYETARLAGIRLAPVPEQGRYVKYLGMILLA